MTITITGTDMPMPMLLSRLFTRSSVLAALLAIGAADAGAVVQVYTSQAAYLAALPSTYTDTFGDLAPDLLIDGPLVRSGGAAYIVHAVDLGGYGPGQGANALYVLGNGSGGSLLSTNMATSALRFDAFHGPVRGLGGYFFGTDFDGASTAGRLTFTIHDATGTFSYSTIMAPGSFIGFGSTGQIDSLMVVVSQSDGPQFATAGALAVSVVPEPSSLALMGVAALSLLGMARRRR